MDEKKRQEIALKRFALISPVLNGFEDNAAAYFRSVCEHPIEMPHYGVREYSPKTLHNWLSDYNRNGFDALKPGYRSDRGKSRKMTPEVEKSILEKIKDFPRMKGSVIYDQLVDEEKINPGKLSRSTFYRYLANQPSLGDVREPVDKTKRFSYKFINELWQADVMYGPRIKDGRRKRETYLICFLDDASRLIPYSAFAFEQDFLTLRKLLKEAVLRRGKPKMLYTDNGQIYRTQQLALICAGFGCSVVHARPYHAAGKGKQERFFRTVRTRFLSTIDPNSVTLEELNERYWDWLERDYHRKKHSALDKSPLEFFMEQANQIEHIGDIAVADALFLLRVQRKVRSNATLQINNVIYETDYSLVGSSVEVRYEPEWIGKPQHKLPLYVDDIHVGDASFIQLHDNAVKRRPPGRPTLEASVQQVRQENLSKVSYKQALKGAK